MAYKPKGSLICVDCRTEAPVRGSHQVRCGECQAIHNRERHRIRGNEKRIRKTLEENKKYKYRTRDDLKAKLLEVINEHGGICPTMGYLDKNHGHLYKLLRKFGGFKEIEELLGQEIIRLCWFCKRPTPSSQTNSAERDKWGSGRRWTCKACHEAGFWGRRHLDPRRRISMMVGHTRARAKQRGLMCDLTIDWVLSLYYSQGERCALTGIEFSTEDTNLTHKNPFGISIDRIDSSGGYTKDNVRLVCLAVNIAMSNWGEDVFARIATAYVGKAQH